MSSFPGKISSIDGMCHLPSQYDTPHNQSSLFDNNRPCFFLKFYYTFFFDFILSSFC